MSQRSVDAHLYERRYEKPVITLTSGPTAKTNTCEIAENPGVHDDTPELTACHDSSYGQSTMLEDGVVEYDKAKRRCSG